MEAPERIYNIDEPVIDMEQAQQMIVCSSKTNSREVTSQKQSNVLIIA